MTTTEVEKFYDERFDCDLEIELHEGVLYVHNNLNLGIEIPYSSDEEVSNICKLIVGIHEVFDFSISLEFHTIKELKDFVKK